MRLRPSRILFALVALFVVVQIVPYGRSHTNPPVVQEPQWDSPETRELARAACFDCHSNETTWPAYSWVAPTSWFLQNHVDGGRRHLNFSEWNRPQRHAKDAAGQIKSGDMPMTTYTWMHPASRLSAADKERLAQAFEKMFGKPEPRPAR